MQDFEAFSFKQCGETSDAIHHDFFGSDDCISRNYSEYQMTLLSVLILVWWTGTGVSHRRLKYYDKHKHI